MNLAQVLDWIKDSTLSNVWTSISRFEGQIKQNHIYFKGTFQNNLQ